MLITDIEIINCIIVLICGFCGAAFVISEINRRNKAKEWQEKYGNTDFENPYDRK